MNSRQAGDNPIRDYLFCAGLITLAAIAAILCPSTQDPDIAAIRFAVIATAVVYDLFMVVVFGIVGFILLCGLAYCKKAR